MRAGEGSDLLDAMIPVGLRSDPPVADAQHLCVNPHLLPSILHVQAAQLRLRGLGSEWLNFS